MKITAIETFCLRYDMPYPLIYARGEYAQREALLRDSGEQRARLLGVLREPRARGARAGVADADRDANAVSVAAGEPLGDRVDGAFSCQEQRPQTGLDGLDGLGRHYEEPKRRL